MKKMAGSMKVLIYEPLSNLQIVVDAFYIRTGFWAQAYLFYG
jgi:hypothetical protein